MCTVEAMGVGAWEMQPSVSESGKQIAVQDLPFTYLAALAGADPIMVARGLVIADKTRLVDPWGRGWRRGAGHHLLRTCALGLHCCRGKQEYMRDRFRFSVVWVCMSEREHK